ncbi:TnsA-like heteromeric transposase endonuclease subunit [Nocardia sp. NPDC127606]|uniref:TnsA-like heteromeric transposase endonuclease subunit n=1 Tax=Nocardia sp. NPDC127606 TaxID=3345406 RepID=UPI003633BDDE
MPFTRIAYRNPDNAIVIRRVTPVVATLPLELSPPVRALPAWPGRSSHQGRYWHSRSGHYVKLESRFEAAAVLLIDFQQQLRSLAAQPFWILWPDPSTTARHAPDFFGRDGRGRGWVIDVHPRPRLDRRNREQFQATEALCQRLGWRFVLVDAIDETLRRNVEVLAAYRHPRYAPDPTTARALRRIAAEQPICLDDLATRIAAERGLTRSVALSAIYHLAWNRRLHMDLSRPLAMSRRVRR